MSEYMKDKFIEDFEKIFEEKKMISSYDVLTGRYVPTQIFKDYIIGFVQKINSLEASNHALNRKVEQLEAEIAQMKECFEETKYFGRFKRGKNGL